MIYLVLALLLLSPFLPAIDLTLSQCFHPFSGPNFLYSYGEYPGFLFGCAAIATLALAPFISRLKRYRRDALLITLVFALGNGLIVNAILKDHWGRPRPRQIEQFGGTLEFRPHYSPNWGTFADGRKSFPCGHCSMAFLFFALIPIARRHQNRLLEVTGWVFAIGGGIALGITRMAQGGHFFSDVLFAGAILWCLTWLVDWVLQD